MHLLRDRHELKEQHPENADVQQWAKDVKAVYDRAVAYTGPDPSLPRPSKRLPDESFNLPSGRSCGSSVCT